MKVLVTGSRDLLPHHEITVWRELDFLLHAGTLDTLVVGDCPTGGDLYARRWHNDLGGPAGVELILGIADWENLGKPAGPARNRWMVDQCSIGDECLAFFQEGARGAGTGNCSLMADLAGLCVHRFTCPLDEGPVFES